MSDTRKCTKMGERIIKIFNHDDIAGLLTTHASTMLMKAATGPKIRITASACHVSGTSAPVASTAANIRVMADAAYAIHAVMPRYRRAMAPVTMFGTQEEWEEAWEFIRDAETVPDMMRAGFSFLTLMAALL